MNDRQKRHLRGLAHALKPVVMIGNKGLTDTVLAEIDTALAHHELIKVKLSGADKATKQLFLDKITHQHHAVLINIVGHTAILYRPADDPKIILPR